MFNSTFPYLQISDVTEDLDLAEWHSTLITSAIQLLQYTVESQHKHNSHYWSLYGHHYNTGCPYHGGGIWGLKRDQACCSLQFLFIGCPAFYTLGFSELTTPFSTHAASLHKLSQESYLHNPKTHWYTWISKIKVFLNTLRAETS